MNTQAHVKFAFLTSTAFLMAAVAGFIDVIGFVGVNKLFTAHITGNIVVAFAEIIHHTPGVASKLIALPLFILLAMIVTALIEKYGQTKELLAFWFLAEVILLIGFMLAGVFILPKVSISSVLYITAGMLAVAAMAIHNTLLRTYMPHFPACTAMTGNLAQFVVDLVSYFWGWRFKYNLESRSKSHAGIKRFGNVLAGFSAGGAFAATSYIFLGFWAVTFAIIILVFMANRSFSLN